LLKYRYIPPLSCIVPAVDVLLLLNVCYQFIAAPYSLLTVVFSVYRSLSFRSLGRSLDS
jgi:hypothetical protein